jgi:hypothetical protein
VVANVGAPSFAYAGAWSSPLYGLQIAPAGTATARVQRTGTLGMTVLGKGQRYQVTVDFKHRAIRTIRTCSCLLNVTLVTGLTPSPHIVWVTNVSNRYLAMRNWFADKGAIFRQVFAPNSALASVIDSSHPMTFFVTGASTVAVDYEAARTMLHVRINDAVVPYDVRTSGLGEVERTTVAWGLPGGVTKVELTPAAGLHVTNVVASQLPGGRPSFLSRSAAGSMPLMAVYGDSVAEGRNALGPGDDADGFAARVAAKAGWRLANLAAPGTSASCYGERNVGSVVAADPATVIVAYGMEDMLPGADASGCSATLASFEAAMATILASLQRHLPSAKLYVQAILPTSLVDAKTRAAWNAVLAAAAHAHGAVFVDPGTDLNRATDYAGPVLPNNRGQAKLAAAWEGALASS